MVSHFFKATVNFFTFKTWAVLSSSRFQREKIQYSSHVPFVAWVLILWHHCQGSCYNHWKVIYRPLILSHRMLPIDLRRTLSWELGRHSLIQFSGPPLILLLVAVDTVHSLFVVCMKKHKMKQRKGPSACMYLVDIRALEERERANGFRF